MSENEHPRFRAGTLVTVVGLALVATLAADGRAGPKARKRRLATVTRLDTPFSRFQGGDSIVIPFSVTQQGSRQARIQVEYGIDRNGDGVVATGDDPLRESEYRSATQDRRDPRDTRRRGPGKRYKASPQGAGHAFSWRAGSDLPVGVWDAQGPLLVTPQGRPIVDPDHPEDFLRAEGDTGVKIRIRTVVGRRRRQVVSAWSSTSGFTVDMNNAPVVTLDRVTRGDVVLVDWTGIDRDSEDANNNGVLDILGDEDLDGDGEFDRAPVAMAFDFHRVEAGEDPASLTSEELEALPWMPCTRTDGVGDPDDGAPTSPAGVEHVFAWDWQADPVTPSTVVVLRVRGYDGFEHSDYVYFTDAFTPVE